MSVFQIRFLAIREHFMHDHDKLRLKREMDKLKEDINRFGVTDDISCIQH